MLALHKSMCLLGPPELLRQTRRYQQCAEALGDGTSARAVRAAVQVEAKTTSCYSRLLEYVELDARRSGGSLSEQGAPRSCSGNKRAEPDFFDSSANLALEVR